MEAFTQQQNYFNPFAHVFWLSRGMTIGVRVAIFNQHNEVLLVKHTYANNWSLPVVGWTVVKLI